LIALGEDPEGYVKSAVGWFEEHNIDVSSDMPAAEISYTHSGGVRIVGSSDKAGESDIRSLLLTYGVKNAVVKVSKEATLDDIESIILGRRVKRSLFVSLKKRPSELPVDVTILDPHQTLDTLAEHILRKLRLIRIYTRRQGEVIDRPLLIERESTVIDAAREIHKDMARYFRYGRVWRRPSMNGVRVGGSFRLEDGDILEIHSL